MASPDLTPGARVTYLRFPRAGIDTPARLAAVVVRTTKRRVLVDAQLRTGEIRRMRVSPENLEAPRG